ncbi:MAG: RidA family protein [Defluviitaleaceae bacterium]|nr:RidA family protein [Defluviitaleaceae bacterium]
MNLKKDFISTENAPAAIGPYAQGTTFGDLIFTSGQLPIDSATGKMVDGDIKDATRQVLKNVQAILQAADSGLDNVLKATVYLSDMANFVKMNEVYNEFFGTNPPARTCFQVAKLPMDAIVEIEVIAHR